MTQVAQLPTINLSCPPEFVNDKRRKGWTLLEDVPLEGTPVLELVKFLKDGEEYVNGKTMLSRAKKLGGLCGQRHAERLLSMVWLIPEEWQKFYLVFPGTLWRDSSGSRSVTFLHFSADRWILEWLWFKGGWPQVDHLVRLCPQ